jgi:8-oxo-dGTP diphosphatase
MEINFRIAVKAFIVHEDKLLVIKRRSNDVHKPGEWDIPGGRLEIGEDPHTGVAREALEEAGIAITPVMPIAINHFTRDDGQLITMIIFLCQPESTEIKLSEEHQEYEWRAFDAEFPKWLGPIVKTYREHIK